MEPVFVQNLQDNIPKKSRLLEKNPSPIEKACSTIHSIMLQAPKVSSDTSEYNLQSHLSQLNDVEYCNVMANIRIMSEVTGMNQELFFTNGQEAEKELKKFIFPDVQPAVDNELIKREEKLTKVLKCVKELFEYLSEKLNNELTVMEKKYAFETVKEAIVAYHGVYHQYKDYFFWIEINYKEVIETLDTRNQSDQETNASVSILGLITPTYFYDEVQVRKDTLASLALTYTMEESQLSKDLEGFHPTTVIISTKLSNLKSLYAEYNNFRNLAERRWCKITFCYIANEGNGLYLDSWFNKFEKEYDETVPRDTRKHFHIYKKLDEISPKLMPDIIVSEQKPLTAAADDNQ